MRRLDLLIAVTLLTLTAAPRPIGAQVSAGGVPADSIAAALGLLGVSDKGLDVNGRFSRGHTSVAKGDTVQGPLVVVGGTAEVFGVVAGNVYALWGDVVVHEGADVFGGASAFHGRVIVEGGRVRGAMRVSRAAAAPSAAATPPISRGRALQLASAWTAMFAVVGILVLVLLSANLEATARALEQDFGRAFFFGVLGQLGFIPVLLLLCLGLVVTIVGALLVPFALVAAPVALAGLVMLGLLALALVTGRALLRARHDGSSRAEAVRALTFGVLALMLPWIAVAALQGTGSAALAARIVAVAVSWAAATAGLGAAILSRAGTPRRRVAERPQPLQGWQTPTPVTGVAAARRPIPARPGATPQ